MPRRSSTTRAPRLEFDSDAHVYHLDGRRIPGISEVLRAAGVIGPEMAQIPEQYRIRGLAVHEWTEADDLGRVTPSMVIPPIVAPYLEAWRRFRREACPQIIAVEELVYERLGRFATRVDRRVTLNGGEWLLNLKTGGAYPHYPIQCAMEALCYRVGMRRACVHLSKEGAYKLVEHTDPRDFRVAEQAIRTYYANQATQAR